jgi:hypothetical protein
MDRELILGLTEDSMTVNIKMTLKMGLALIHGLMDVNMLANG